MREEEIDNIEAAKKTIQASQQKEAEDEQNAIKKCQEKIQAILQEDGFVMLATMPSFRQDPVQVGQGWFLEMSEPQLRLVRPNIAK